MLAAILIATSATIVLFLGLAHIYLTFFTRVFAARDAALEENLKSVSPRINDRIDEAYRAKYHGSPYLKPMVGVGGRSATVKVMPRQIKVSA